VVPQRATLGYLNPNSQAKYNEAQPLYMAERTVRDELQLYRTSILMCHRYALDEAQLQQTRDWLEACPIRSILESKNHASGS
jgi:hypothetical protein